MTIELLVKICEENNTQKDVELMSDSGWECGPTEMNGIWYNRNANAIVFTQTGDETDYRYYDEPEWECICGKEKDFKDKNGYSIYHCSRDKCVSSVDGLCYRKDRENCDYFGWN